MGNRECTECSLPGDEAGGAGSARVQKQLGPLGLGSPRFFGDHVPLREIFAIDLIGTRLN